MKIAKFRVDRYHTERNGFDCFRLWFNCSAMTFTHYSQIEDRGEVLKNMKETVCREIEAAFRAWEKSEKEEAVG